MKEKKLNQVVANVTMPVSFKYTVNVGKWIKNDNVDKAIAKLQKVISKELPLPLRTFNKDIPHKKGLGFGGRYPKNVSEHIIKSLKLLKDNAKAKGLDESKLIINEFIANYAISKNKRGRYNTGRSTHLKLGAVIKE